MKNLILVILYISFTLTIAAQKPAIDSSAYNIWPSLEGVRISNDGKYALYKIELGTSPRTSTEKLVIQSTQGPWKQELPGIQGGDFTSDSRKVVFRKGEDSLGMIDLTTSAIDYYPHVTGYRLAGKGEWMIYLQNEPANNLVLHNLLTGNEKKFTDVESYLFSDDGKKLLLKTKTEKNGSIIKTLKWVITGNGETAIIWEGTEADNFILDENGNQLAFTGIKDTSHLPGVKKEKTIWYYQSGTEKAIVVADSSMISQNHPMEVDGIQEFSKDGRRLFFSIKKVTETLTPKPDAVPVDVWSYRDHKLQSQQLGEGDRSRSYLAVVDLDNRRILRLEQEFENCTEWRDDWAFIERKEGQPGIGEDNWNMAARTSWYFVSLKDGSRKQVTQGGSASFNGKYIIYYEPEQRNYFTYEIASGVTRNITKSLAVSWLDTYVDDKPRVKSNIRGIAGWLQNDAAVLLYDRYDIWRIDPAGKEKPINLTNGYGRRHNIVFSVALRIYREKAFAANKQIILNAFNLINKENGFFRKTLDKTGDPEKLTMENCIYEAANNPYIPQGCGFSPVKAQDAETYLVQRMSATEPPNLFATTDFKNFTRLSNIHPGKGYNWYTTTLHTWKSLDGRMLQGILYKPENFDPSKKYPVIFYYYERMSDGLNAYLKPMPSDCRLNIPTYVSNGYLVFSPDIHYTVGDPMQGVYNSVVSAANYISTLPFVDSKKMGIQGCSMGGFETNYLVTHTDKFAAACSSSGLFNLVSSYGSLIKPDPAGFGGGESVQSFYEIGQARMGYTLWQRLDLYIKNSPIFNAHKVTTPFLMMHTKKDGICHFEHAVEFFTGLRRLGKKAWMLQYDDGFHGIGGKSADDFTLRMSQFFDHYLKDKPAPKWMLEGIPARLKGIETGLELDNTGKKPGPGLLKQETR